MPEAGFTDVGNGTRLLEGDLDYYTVPDVLARAGKKLGGGGEIRAVLVNLHVHRIGNQRLADERFHDKTFGQCEGV